MAAEGFALEFDRSSRYIECMADEDLLNRFRFVIAEQTKALKERNAEIERLNAVIERSADALTVLQSIYTDPSIKPEIRTAAAKAVLPHQHPKVTVLGYANMNSLARRLDEARPKVIEHDPKSAA